MPACRRTSKSQLLKKLQKALTFRLDNQRQISLDLSHTCRNRKRLISLINFATLYFVRRQACREYSMYAARCSSIRRVCLCIRGVCSYIQRDVSLFLLFVYSISQINNVTMNCRFENQLMTSLLTLNAYSKMNYLISRFFAQFEFV
jgi:hypothetical protein